MECDFEATVLDVREERRVGTSARWQLLLTQAGASAGTLETLEAVSRNGTRLQLAVLATVCDAAGQLWCVVEKPLAAGTAVRGRYGEPNAKPASME